MIPQDIMGRGMMNGFAPKPGIDGSETIADTASFELSTVGIVAIAFQADGMLSVSLKDANAYGNTLDFSDLLMYIHKDTTKIKFTNNSGASIDLNYWVM